MKRCGLAGRITTFVVKRDRKLNKVQAQLLKAFCKGKVN